MCNLRQSASQECAGGVKYLAHIASYTVYRETFALLNFCEFHEFNSILKISLANFLQLWAWQMVTLKI